MAGRLIAIGDIHGCYRQLAILVEQELTLQKEDKAIFLGDYIDRGPHGKQVLDYLMQLIKEGYNIIPLMGNHEDLLIKALYDSRYYMSWLYNGGDTTLKSFGVYEPQEVGSLYIDFIRSLNYYHIEGDLIFVHAGLNDNISNPFEDKVQMLWSRDDHYTNKVLQGKTIVHGHSIVTIDECRSFVENNSNVINIDTGCFLTDSEGTGYLTAIQLPERKLYSVANG